MAEQEFWEPTEQEWKALCEVHKRYDPENVLRMVDGSATAIFLADKPVDDIARGMAIIAQREEAARQKAELARTEEEAQKDADEREHRKAVLEKEYKRREEKGKEYQKHTAMRKKAFTADDPYEASVLNAVDKDMRSRNANYIIHAKRLSELPKIALSDPEEIRERVDFYYQLCVTDGVRPNLPGLALAFGLTRTGLINAMSDRRMTRDAAQELGRGIAMMDEILSGMVLDGRVMPVAAIYLMNNWLGYKNASEVTTRTETVETGVDQKALEQKYQSVIDVE